MTTDTRNASKSYPVRLYQNDRKNRDAIVHHYRQRDPTIDFAKLLRLMMQQHADVLRSNPNSFPLLSHE